MLNSPFATTHLWRSACPGGPGAGQGATRNGDVNCDGKVNISDPIYLLESLFRGGPEPCALAQNAEVCCQDLLDGLKKVEAAISSIHPWPPQPENIVNMSGELHLRGEVIPIYTVPEDKWLLVTDFSGGGVPLRSLETRKPPKRLRLIHFHLRWGSLFIQGPKLPSSP